MAAEPRDGRYEHLKPDIDFWPAPDFEGLPKNEPTPGVFLTNTISVWAPKVPYSPAYFGWGVFTFAPRHDQRRSRSRGRSRSTG